MISPGDEEYNGKPVLFVTRWNILIKILIVEPSIKLVGRTAVEYGLYDGTGVFPGNQRLARETSLTERTVREAWRFLRAEGMAERIQRSAWDGDQRTADDYLLVIPEGWRHMPILGPLSGRFTCQHCGHLFNPQAGHSISKDGHVLWTVPKMVFCPKTRSGTSCFADWQAERKRKKQPAWNAPEHDPWKMFRQARNDDWL